MSTGIILVVVLLLIVTISNLLSRIVPLSERNYPLPQRDFPLPELKEQFTIAEEDKRAYIQDMFPTIEIPEHEFPTLINKLDYLRFVMRITQDKIREQLKPLLLDYLIPNYYAIKYRDPGQTNEELSGKKQNYAFIYRDDSINVSRAEAEKHFEKSKQYQLTQLMIGPQKRKMEYEIQLVYVETKNGIITNEIVENVLNEWSLSF
ncbi:MAG: hypothetical protein IPP02_14000 [Chitinophagaceae bacterium]|nr:hypothetical protein [Chitinophagaceae bacterium]